LSNSKKLIELTRPLRDYLLDNYGEMSVAIITPDSIQISKPSITIKIVDSKKEDNCEL
jgi:hypothetical protein